MIYSNIFIINGVCLDVGFFETEKEARESVKFHLQRNTGVLSANWEYSHTVRIDDDGHYLGSINLLTGKNCNSPKRYGHLTVLNGGAA